MANDETRPESRQWSEPVRYIVLVVLMIAFVVAFYLARGSAAIILIAVIISYILSPMIRFLTWKVRMKRTFAVIISYFLLILMIAFIFALVIPLLTNQITQFFSSDWVTIIEAVDKFLENLIREMEVNKLEFRNFKIDLTIPLIELRKSINSIDLTNLNLNSYFQNISEAIQSIVFVSANVVSRIFAMLIAILTTLMTSIHLATDGFKLKGLIIMQFPARYRPEINELTFRLKRVWNNYFIGQIKLMLWIGGITTVVCLALGLRWAIVLGIIAGLFEVVPNIGPILSLVPGVFSAAIFGSSWIPLNNFMIVIIVIGAYILIQQLENVLIVPKVMGNVLDIHPVAVILGILILSSRIGIIGALLAAPIIGLLKVILGFILCKLRKEDPYPELYMSKEEETDLAAN